MIINEMIVKLYKHLHLWTHLNLLDKYDNHKGI
jgi:hypothetical protein